MLDLSSLKLMSYYVVGLGITGQSTVKALAAAGVRVYAYNDGFREQPKNLPEGVRYAKPTDVPWDELDGLILSPGIPHTFPQPHLSAELAREHGVPILCDIDLLADCYPANVFIGVTGTNGKSTTTALLNFMLPETKCGGNIGIPVCDISDVKPTDPILLELSSYHLERTPHLECDVAVILNITEDHIERHGSMAGYIDAKKNILLPRGVEQTVIIGVDTPATRDIYEEIKSDAAKIVIPISTQKVLDVGISIVDGVVFDDGTEITTLKSDLPLQGQHNHQNIAAAYAVHRAFGFPFDFDVLAKFTGLPHRMQVVFHKDNLKIMNDSKATNIDSTLNVVATLSEGEGVLLLGGVPKATGLDGLEQYRNQIHTCIVYGQARDSFKTYLKAHDMPYIDVDSFKDAVKTAYEHALQQAKSQATTVLLSPACASFDEFQNFEERGDAFMAMIANLRATTAENNNDERDQ